MRRRIRNAYTKAVGREWYKKMLAAKQAKADKAKRETLGPLDEAPKPAPNPLSNVPKSERKRLEVTEPTHMTPMEEHTSTTSAIERALQKLEQQARGL